MAPYLQILGGIVALYAGGELMMHGAVSVSKKMRIPQILIGLTIVSIATSMPEIMVAIRSSLQGIPDLAVGSVVGTNIVNVYLILALSALIMPIVVDKIAIRENLFIMIAASASLLGVGFFFGEIGKLAGLLFLGALIAYYIYSYRHAQNHQDCEEVVDDIAQVSSLWMALLFVALSALALTFGSNWLVDGASAIAQKFGVTEAVIGLTIVAFGTSLPELTLCVIGAVRGHSEIAFGNIVGSSIINIFAVLGIAAMIKPIPINPSIMRFDIPLLFILTLLLAIILKWRGKLSRPTAVVFLVIYASYLAYTFMTAIG